MPRFFVRSNQIADGVVTVMGDDAHHISRSLRMAVGDRITVCDMQRLEYECELTDFLPTCVLAKILKIVACDTEPPYHAHVYQALPKGDKLDSIIQKAVECGMAELTTFESERCVVRVKDAAEGKKLERRERIALEAAKQSGRGRVPQIHPTLSFAEAIKQAATAEIPLFCYEGDGTEPLPHVLERCLAERAGNTDSFPTVAIVIGSEGGFSQVEAQAAIDAGLLPVGLGKRILRTETAASFVLSCLVYRIELSE
ncbi:MAG: 16S rRNA (uracil(1498)-N(3))-methyltransferase [Clostridia bacterium]|nr:16S rRNA (uracil(1498)-N(3))-methyltransferase [Clostridia bacterium]